MCSAAKEGGAACGADGGGKGPIIGRAGCSDAVAPHALPQRLAADAQALGGRLAVPAGGLQGFEQLLALFLRGTPARFLARREHGLRPAIVR